MAGVLTITVAIRRGHANLQFQANIKADEITRKVDYIDTLHRHIDQFGFFDVWNAPRLKSHRFPVVIKVLFCSTIQLVIALALDILNNRPSHSHGSPSYT
jgi:hypothetical protein